VVRNVRYQLEILFGNGLDRLRRGCLGSAGGQQGEGLIFLWLAKQLSANLDAKQLCKHTGHGVAYLPLDRGNTTRHLMILWEGLQGAQLLCG
jgi:hypothetical protein